MLFCARAETSKADPVFRPQTQSGTVARHLARFHRRIDESDPGFRIAVLCLEVPPDRQLRSLVLEPHRLQLLFASQGHRAFE